MIRPPAGEREQIGRTRLPLILLAAALALACPVLVARVAPAARTSSAASVATPSSSPISTRASSQIAAYAFPSSIDPAARYLFYLHGAIIEDQGLPAVSPEFGEYQYEAILKALASHGLVVISEQRPSGTDPAAYAERIKLQASALLHAGVEPGSITVVGASKGASIAADASYRLRNPSMNFVLVASCPSSMIGDWRMRGQWLYGNVLAIRDAADDEYSGSCDGLFQISAGRGLGRSREIVLHLGLGHGIVYRPLDEWILPTVQWAGG